MYRFFYVFGFSVLLILLSCNNESETAGSLSLGFEATYAGQTLQFLEGYQATDQYSIQFTKSDFYLSDISIVSDKGEEIILSDIEFVNVTEGYSGAQNPIQLSFTDIPVGTYDQLKFGYGVSPSLNSTLPKDYNADHPLSRTSHYWDQWNSYIFSKLEGRLDTLGNGSFDVGFLYHTGKNEIYRLFTFDLPFTISGETTDFMINIDYKKLVKPESGDALPIVKSPINHDPNNIETFQSITSNFGNAMTLTLQ